MRIAGAVLGLVVLGSAGGSAAQQGFDDPEARLSRDLVISAVDVRPDGPAWWVISKGDRSVYILGVLWDTPPDIRWNDKRFTTRLTNARLLLLPTRSVQTPDPANAVFSGPAIPTTYRPRFEAAANSLKQPVDRYLNIPALFAGRLLAQDYRASLGYQTAYLPNALQALASRRGVATLPMGKVTAPPLSQSMAATPDGNVVACLDAALTEVEAGAEPMRSAVEAWSSGDVVGALDHPRGRDVCSLAIPANAELRRQGMALEAGMIGDLLDGRLTLPEPEPGSIMRPNLKVKPRGGVAIIELRSLLAEGGVLDQLRAKGYEIRSPTS